MPTTTVYDTRRRNLRQLMSNWGGPTSLALKLGHANGSYLSQLVGPHPTRKISEGVARQMERTLALPAGYLDETHQAPQTLPGGLMPEVPPALVEADLLASVAATVFTVIEAAGAHPSKEKMAFLVQAAYRHALDSGKVDPAYFAQLVKLSS